MIIHYNDTFEILLLIFLQNFFSRMIELFNLNENDRDERMSIPGLPAQSKTSILTLSVLKTSFFFCVCSANSVHP